MELVSGNVEAATLGTAQAGIPRVVKAGVEDCISTLPSKGNMIRNLGMSVGVGEVGSLGEGVPALVPAQALEDGVGQPRYTISLWTGRDVAKYFIRVSCHSFSVTDTPSPPTRSPTAL